MKYTVVWMPAAERELAHLWTTASARQPIADAADQIDDLLARDPWSQGESRSENRRLMFLRPLTLFFDIDESQRHVYVLAVALARRPH